MLKKAIFRLICIGVFGASAAVIWFLASTLLLRTEYRETALEINDAFIESDPEIITVSQGGITLPASRTLVDFYDRFLLDRTTTVFNRKPAPPEDTTISIQCGNRTLSFTGLDDESATQICWKGPEEEKNFTVRSQVTFIQLNSYFQNYKRKSAREE